MTALRTCRSCGCTDLHACAGGCEWALLDIETPTGVCSTCAAELDWDMLSMANCGWYADFDEPVPRVLAP